jgi:hypothetical protein
MSTTPNRPPWNAGPLAPGLPAGTGLDSYPCPACRDGDTLSLDITPLTGSVPDHQGMPGSAKQDAISRRLRVERNGTTLADLSSVHNGDVTVDPAPATYRVGYDLGVTDPALPLRIAPRQAPGTPQRPVRQVILAVSDGSGWTTEPVANLGNGEFQTVLDLPASASGCVLAPRLSALDETGGTLDQQIDAALIGGT